MTERIQAERLLSDIATLGRIGASDAGGVSRPALSEADVAGRTWFRTQAEAAGLVVSTDDAGNLSARLPSPDPEARTILMGSHLDTVPGGGRYDGALGVLCGLEVLRCFKEDSQTLPYHLEVINFTDEEGSIFSMLGSRAFAGLLSEADLIKAPNSAALTEGLERLSLTPEGILKAQRDPETVAAFLEVHIEQGTRLEDAQLNIGLVTDIVGIRRFELTFTGQAAHAGTMPMAKRQDALWAAADFVLKARAHIMTHFSPGVVNCGQLSLPDSAPNIVPAIVKLMLEFRHGSDEMLDAMESELMAIAHQAALDAAVTLDIQHDSNITPVGLDEALISTAEQAAQQLGLQATRLLSFAGHDTQSIASAGIPSALLFIPSVDGISHNPAEFSADHDVVNGASMLLEMVRILCSA